MLNRRFIPLQLVLFLFLMASCASEKKEALTPGCNSTIYYSTDIKPILGSKCLSCHSNVPSYMNGGDFTDYNILKSVVDNGHFNDRVFVKKDMPMSGFQPLTGSELSKLKCWLDQGARNN